MTVELNPISRLQSAMQEDVQKMRVRVLELEAIDRSGPFTRSKATQLIELRAAIRNREVEIQSIHNSKHPHQTLKNSSVLSRISAFKAFVERYRSGR